MVQADPNQSVEEDETSAIVVGYDDLELLETGDVDAFVLSLNEHQGAAPYYVEVDGRRFTLQRDTYLVRGHGAHMPAWIRAQEAEERLVLLAERNGRYLVYIHDPSASDDEDDGGDGQ